MINHSTALAIVAGTALVLTAVRPVAAKPPDACTGDISKLCSDVKPGGGRIVFCLHEHAAQLTPECQTALKEKQKTVAQSSVGRHGATSRWTTACASDIQKLCPDVRMGGGRVAACLRSHQAELSDHCNSAFTPKTGP